MTSRRRNQIPRCRLAISANNLPEFYTTARAEEAVSAVTASAALEQARKRIAGLPAHYSTAQTPCPSGLGNGVVNDIKFRDAFEFISVSRQQREAK